MFSKSVVNNPPSNYKKSSFLLTPPPTPSYSSYTPPSICTIIQPCIRVCCHDPLTHSYAYIPTHTQTHTHSKSAEDMEQYLGKYVLSTRISMMAVRNWFFTLLHQVLCAAGSSNNVCLLPTLIHTPYHFDACCDSGW